VAVVSAAVEPVVVATLVAVAAVLAAEDKIHSAPLQGGALWNKAIKIIN
jgi:hypothetical protein